MFSSSTLAYKRWNMKRWPLSKGPLVTLLVALGLEGLSRLLLDIPSVAPLFLAVAYAAFLGGVQSGLISAAITTIYAAYVFATPGSFLVYSNDNLVRVLIVLSTSVAMAVLVGRLKRRAEHDHAEIVRIQRYQSLLLQSVSDSIIATDAQFRIQTWNRASESIYGWSAAEVCGKPITEVLSVVRYRDNIDNEQARALLQQQSFWKGQVIQRHRDGHEILIESSVRLIHDGDGSTVGVVAVNRDMTEYQQAQTERTQIEERQHFLAQASSVLADSLDYESTIKTVTQLAIPHLADWCVIHLIGEDGTLRRPVAAHVKPELVEIIRELQQRGPIDLDADGPISRTLLTGEPQLAAEVDPASQRAVSADDYHYRMLDLLGFRSYMIVPLIAHGRTLGAATFVSAGRSYTAADLEHAQDLMRRCGMAVDNARLYHEAQEAIQTRNQLVLTVSHDLKNPLSAIKGYANFLQRRVGRMDAPEAVWLDDGLTKIDSTTKKMSALLDEMLDFARLQAGQTLDLDQRPTDLIAVVSQTVAEYQQATERHCIYVATSVPELVGLYDTARLERVLVNLLSNAIKYSPEGGEIVVEVEHISQDGKVWAAINVQDWGLGIPAADLPYIFDPFRRAGNVLGRVRGTGIGLTIARRIVEQHGGALTVASVEGAGSTFTIRLPVAMLTNAAPVSLDEAIL
ncbi:MAG TPA: ATP-binding protein [Herpetosiphonaceae bacterium]